jgi:hypothetical protein
MKVMSMKSPWLGHVIPDIKKFRTFPLIFSWAFKVLQQTAPNKSLFLLELE